MGFFSSLSNFVSTNINSTVQDVAHIGNQIMNNPVTSAIAPALLTSVGVPPNVANTLVSAQQNMFNNIENNGVSMQTVGNVLPSLLGGSQSSTVPNALSSPVIPLQNNVFPSVSTTPTNQTIATSELPQSVVKNDFLTKVQESVKSYWYVYLGVFFAIAVALYVSLKSPKNYYEKSRK